MLGLFLFSCNNSKSSGVLTDEYNDLYNLTDEFVEKLYTTHTSYGMFIDMENARYTKDKEYRVVPLGRLINVKIEHYADVSEYEKLREALESHYYKNSRVNEVYRCGGGTIMIDCR